MRRPTRVGSGGTPRARSRRRRRRGVEARHASPQHAQHTASRHRGLEAAVVLAVHEVPRARHARVMRARQQRRHRGRVLARNQPVAIAPDERGGHARAPRVASRCRRGRTPGRAPCRARRRRSAHASRDTRGSRRRARWPASSQSCSNSGRASSVRRRCAASSGQARSSGISAASRGSSRWASAHASTAPCATGGTGPRPHDAAQGRRVRVSAISSATRPPIDMPSTIGGSSSSRASVEDGLRHAGRA